MAEDNRLAFDDFQMDATEQGAFVEALSDGVSEAVAKAKQKVLESRTEQRQAALLETGNGVRQLLSEMPRPRGAQKNVSDWWRAKENLEARATALDSLAAHEARLTQLDSKGDLHSDARKRVEAEATRLKKILGR